MKIVKLSKVVKELESGSRPKGGVSSDTGTIPSLGAEHLSDEGGFKFYKNKFISIDFFNNLTSGKIKINDILIVKDGATTGKVSFVNNDFPFINAAINEHVFRLEIDTQIGCSKFVFFFLKSSEGKKQILNDFRGATVGGISRQFIESTKIPLPPIDDQIRIADILTRAENLIAKRKESIKALDELLKSTFLEMFGDPVRNEKGWKKKRIDEIAEVRIGPFGSLLHSEDYVANQIPLINPSHIIEGEISPDYSLTITPEKYKELESYQLKKDDVVVARRGEIGRCAIVRTDEPLFCGTGSMFIRITKKYYPLLLQYQIYNTSLKDYLESKAKGVTMKNLNSTTLGNLEVLYPPIYIQTRFATIVEKVESLKAKYQQNLDELEKLYGSLSQQAFSGEMDLNLYQK